LIDRFRAARPGVEIEVIEVLRHPDRAIRDRVLMIPTIIVGKLRWMQAPKLAELIAAVERAESR
jgi:hypothetical protein